MILHIRGANTLIAFTGAITEGFRQEGIQVDESKACDFELIQIHGSPDSAQEDAEILATASSAKFPKVYLIHRPDEVLLNPKLVSYFERDSEAKFIFLGDLVFRNSFWRDRTRYCQVITHPYLDLSMPTETEKIVIGSFTSWGEMRKIGHFIRLTEILKPSGLFEFRIGGSGVDETKIPSHIQCVKEFFVPHFNVQLYHLFGKKRYGESSGSLHRGISIPVIFEANGTERLENLKVVKIASDDSLSWIDFETAANEILSLTKKGLQSSLEKNKESALKNSPRAFAKSPDDCQEIKSEQIRLSLTALNLANVNTTQTPEGGFYRPYIIKSCLKGGCDVSRDNRGPLMKYLPGHPDADKNGYVAFPNLDKKSEYATFSMTATKLKLLAFSKVCGATVLDNQESSFAIRYSEKEGADIKEDIFNFTKDHQIISWMRQDFKGRATTVTFSSADQSALPF